MPNNKVLFSSESVGRGHPDKICDQISDLILDECLKQDRNSRVACEVMAANNVIMIAGEITTTAIVSYKDVALNFLQKLGYRRDFFNVIENVNVQSSDIDFAVSKSSGDIGAGDQGIMFGYACWETPEYMPLGIAIAHKILQRCEYLMDTKAIDGIRSDMKSQVTMDYSVPNDPKVDTIILSVQHLKGIDMPKFRDELLKQAVIPATNFYKMNRDFKSLINASGPFVIGGPIGDTGLTGRKIIVDSYGGKARHGGGAFSGKDPSKVDRSVAYAARWIAKNMVATGFCQELEIQIAYGIGMVEPISIFVNSFGTSRFSDDELIDIIKKEFPLSPSAIIAKLNLLQPNYFKTSVYGHFGRDDQDFTWERLDKVESLRKYISR